MARSAHCPHCDTAYTLREDTPEWSEVTCANCRQTFVLTFPPVPSRQRSSQPADPELSARWRKLLFGSWRIPVAVMAVAALALTVILAIDWSENRARRNAAQQFPRVPLPPIDAAAREDFAHDLGIPESGSQLSADPTPDFLSPQGFRVVIDSMAGSVPWWAPQRDGNYLYERPHAGKQTTEAMQGRGWDVRMLPPFKHVRADAYTGADLIVRMPLSRGSSMREVPRWVIAGYQQAVRQGAVLFLWSDGTLDDNLAEAFGLRLTRAEPGAFLSRLRTHPLVFGIERLPGDWSVATRLPIDAVECGWVQKPGSTEQRPVMGYRPYGEGLVIFCGAAVEIGPPMHDYLMYLAATVERSSIERLKMAGRIRVLPRPSSPAARPNVVPGSGAGGRGVMRRPDRTEGPELLSPIDQTTLPDPAKHEWTFDWSDAEGAREYRMVIVIPTQPRRVIQRTIGKSQVTFTPGMITTGDAPLTGWEWRARSVDQQGRPSNWSRTRSFDVAPRSPDAAEQADSLPPAGDGAF